MLGTREVVSTVCLEFGTSAMLNSLLIALIFPKFVNNSHINRDASGYFNHITIPNFFYSELSYRPRVHCDEQTTGKVEKERILMRVP